MATEGEMAINILEKIAADWESFMGRMAPEVNSIIIDSSWVDVTAEEADFLMALAKRVEV